MISKDISKLKKYCNDYTRIENYDKAISDKENMWHCHHRFEIGSNGEIISQKDLIKQCLYYNRPAEELIFLTQSEHHKLHKTGDKNPFYGKHHTDETRMKISSKISSAETRLKMSLAKKGIQKSAETRLKMSLAKKGIQKSAETRQKISLAKKEYWAKKKIMKES